MSDSKTYQGWTNHSTWCVNLWISNEEGSYRHWQVDQAEECYREAVEAKEDGDRNEWTGDAASLLADRMESEFEEAMPELSGFWSDLLSSALGEVNWYEIAKSYVEELDRQEIEREVRPEPEEEDDSDDEEESTEEVTK